MLLWKNAATKRHLRFYINAPETGIDYVTLLRSQRHIYTADWQEVTIDSLASKTYVRAWIGHRPTRPARSRIGGSGWRWRLDRDGDIDMVAGRDGDSMDMGPMLTGLDLLINRGDGVLDKVAWYERGYVQQDVVFSDLNEDGLLDAVFVDRDFRQPALVVNMGRKNGVPLREGHYPLQGLGGTIVDGDVDGDGDLDLVVLENAVRGGGSGIYILSNQTRRDD